MDSQAWSTQLRSPDFALAPGLLYTACIWVRSPDPAKLSNNGFVPFSLLTADTYDLLTTRQIMVRMAAQRTEGHGHHWRWPCGTPPAAHTTAERSAQPSSVAEHLSQRLPQQAITHTGASCMCSPHRAVQSL